MITIELTPEEAQNLLALVNRAAIQGNEAEAVVLLKQKIINAATSQIIEVRPEESTD